MGACRGSSRAAGARRQKGSYSLSRADVEEFLRRRSREVGTLALWLPPTAGADADGQGAWIARTFAGRAWIAVELLRDGRDRERLAHCRRLGAQHGLPLTRRRRRAHARARAPRACRMR